MMTRKHFKLIAEAISKIKNLAERKELAEFNAKVAAESNPRFNKVRFFAACNVKA